MIVKIIYLGNRTLALTTCVGRWKEYKHHPPPQAPFVFKASGNNGIFLETVSRILLRRYTVCYLLCVRTIILHNFYSWT